MWSAANRFSVGSGLFEHRPEEGGGDELHANHEKALALNRVHLSGEERAEDARGDHEQEQAVDGGDAIRREDDGARDGRRGERAEDDDPDGDVHRRLPLRSREGLRRASRGRTQPGLPVRARRGHTAPGRASCRRGGPKAPMPCGIRIEYPAASRSAFCFISEGTQYAEGSLVPMLRPQLDVVA